MTTIDTIDSLDTLPLSQKMEIWQKLFASVMTDKDNLDGPTRLRLSQTGQCQRRLHYIHSRETPSDPTNLTRRHKLAMGHALEVLAILAFKSYGWETRHTCVDDGGQITLEMQIPGLDDPVQGHPDGICRHENFTENAWIPLECKSTSEFRAAMFEELGIAKVEPSYIMQIAMYGRLMFERGIVDHADRGVFAFISREGGTSAAPRAHKVEPQPQRPGRPAPGPRLPPHRRGPAPRPALRRPKRGTLLLLPLQENMLVRPPPRRAPAHSPGRRHPLDHDQETFEAAAQWLQAKQALDQAKIVLESKLIANANAPISAAGVKAEYFRPSDARSYDMHELGGYLTDEILRRHQNANADKRVFWVHPL